MAPDLADVWWHLYQGEIDDGVSATVIICGSTTHPEQLVAEGKLTAPLTLMSRDIPLHYVRSWDHEPTPIEREHVGVDSDPWKDQ